MASESVSLPPYPSPTASHSDHLLGLWIVLICYAVVLALSLLIFVLVKKFCMEEDDDEDIDLEIGIRGLRDNQERIHHVLDNRRIDQHLRATVPPCNSSGGRGVISIDELKDKLPVVSYSGEKSECAICLEEFEKGESCRVLPSCNHTFHGCCIIEWLKLKGINHSCPMCRADLQLLKV